MVRFLLECRAGFQNRPAGGWARAAAFAVIVPAMFVAGCGESPTVQSPARKDAEATLAREQGIRDGMNLELKKLEGETTILLWRAAIIAGDLKPPVLAQYEKSQLARLLPSWGIGRVWRLWGRRPETMPWYNRTAGLRMHAATVARHDDFVSEVSQRIKAQDRRIDEAKKYLKLVTSDDDGE
jgi:hypothetical protein